MANATASKQQQPQKTPLTSSSSSINITSAVNNNNSHGHLPQHVEPIKQSRTAVSTPTTASPSSASSPIMNQPSSHSSNTAEPQTTTMRSPLEMEASASAASSDARITPEWKKRTGWFRNTRTHRDNQRKIVAQQMQQQQQHQNQEAPPDFLSFSYQGGQMETDAPPIVTAAATSTSTYTMGDAPSNNPSSNKSFVRSNSASSSTNNNHNEANPLQRIQSWMTRSSTDSLNDFDESEWTPADSSYGAAIPVAGWIPKNTRRMIEYSLIAATTALLVYVLVASSIQITADARSGNNNNNANGGENGNVNLDDQFYIDYNNRSMDDDSFENNNGRELTLTLHKSWRYHDDGWDHEDAVVAEEQDWYPYHDTEATEDTLSSRLLWRRFLRARPRLKQEEEALANE